MKAQRKMEILIKVNRIPVSCGTMLRSQIWVFLKSMKEIKKERLKIILRNDDQLLMKNINLKPKNLTIFLKTLLAFALRPKSGRKQCKTSVLANILPEVLANVINQEK